MDKGTRDNVIRWGALHTIYPRIEFEKPEELKPGCTDALPEETDGDPYVECGELAGDRAEGGDPYVADGELAAGELYRLVEGGDPYVVEGGAKAGLLMNVCCLPDL